MARQPPLSDCLTAEVRESFPEVVSYFAGEKDEKGYWDPSPCTISLWYDEGRLKACVKPKHDNLIAFTTLSDVDGLLEALERHFCKVDLEWKVPTRKK